MSTSMSSSPSKDPAACRTALPGCAPRRARCPAGRRFCEMVKAMGCTCITISHRPALMAFHDLVLALDGALCILPAAGADPTGPSCPVASPPPP